MRVRNIWELCVFLSVGCEPKCLRKRKTQDLLRSVQHPPPLQPCTSWFLLCAGWGPTQENEPTCQYKLVYWRKMRINTGIFTNVIPFSNMGYNCVFKDFIVCIEICGLDFVIACEKMFSFAHKIKYSNFSANAFYSLRDYAFSIAEPHSSIRCLVPLT